MNVVINFDWSIDLSPEIALTVTFWKAKHLTFLYHQAGAEFSQVKITSDNFNDDPCPEHLSWLKHTTGFNLNSHIRSMAKDAEITIDSFDHFTTYLTPHTILCLYIIHIRKYKISLQPWQSSKAFTRPFGRWITFNRTVLSFCWPKLYSYSIAISVENLQAI